MTDEKESLVDAWVAKYKPEYPIAILKSGKVEDAIGVKFFPTAAVVDPEGLITFSGSAGLISSPLKAAMKKAEKKPLFPKALAKTRKLLKDEKLGDAYEEFLDIDSNGSDPMIAGYRSMLEIRIDSEVSSAKKFVKAGLYYRAIALAEPIAEIASELSSVAEAKTLLTELQASEDLDEELKGGRGYQKGEDLEAEGEYLDAVKAYRKVYRTKKYTGTKIAAAAEARARYLVDKGKPGYSSSCSACRRKKRACTKHAKKVDL